MIASMFSATGTILGSMQGSCLPSIRIVLSLLFWVIVCCSFCIDGVGFTAKRSVISCPVEMPPSIPPALLLLNPETGYPTRNNLLSVSIITAESFEADVLSTSAFIMGLAEGKELIENRKGIEAIFVTEDNNVYLTSGLKNRVEIINSDFKIIEGVK